MSETLSIGEVARRSGVAASALRFYEERGLISSERAGSGHRRFPRPVLRRIAFVVFASGSGSASRRSALSSRSCRPNRRPRAATGRASRPPGPGASTGGSPSWSDSGSASPSASAAAASRWIAAGSPTPATALPGSARARVTGSATRPRTPERRRAIFRAWRPRTTCASSPWPCPGRSRSPPTGCPASGSATGSSPGSAKRGCSSSGARASRKLDREELAELLAESFRIRAGDPDA